ncbi:MAG TPA: hypothetical protein VLW49_01435 [Gaiellaceae bacterium]|nr:hypothetical protein [Gaiellaceae bacterium]
MADERVRIEIGFAGGQIVGEFVVGSSADALESTLDGDSRQQVVVLDTEDGPLHVVVAHVAYYKRIVRAGRVGFGTS